MSSARYKSRAITATTGFSAELLRAWERRFDLLRPERTEGGHRLYTDDDLAVLQYIRGQMDEGRAIGGLAAMGRDALLAAARATPDAPTSRWPKTPDAEVPDGFPACLPTMTRQAIDRLPYGVVRVDEDGKVELYNRTEAQFAGYEEADVLGKNFFTEVAPCCNNPLLRGRFLTSVQQAEFDFAVAYTFTYRMAPTNVIVRCFGDAATGTRWVIVRPG